MKDECVTIPGGRLLISSLIFHPSSFSKQEREDLNPVRWLSQTICSPRSTPL